MTKPDEILDQLESELSFVIKNGSLISYSDMQQVKHLVDMIEGRKAMLNNKAHFGMIAVNSSDVAVKDIEMSGEKFKKSAEDLKDRVSVQISNALNFTMDSGKEKVVADEGNIFNTPNINKYLKSGQFSLNKKNNSEAIVLRTCCGCEKVITIVGTWRYDYEIPLLQNATSYRLDAFANYDIKIRRFVFRGKHLDSKNGSLMRVFEESTEEPMKEIVEDKPIRKFVPQKEYVRKFFPND